MPANDRGLFNFVPEIRRKRIFGSFLLSALLGTTALPVGAAQTNPPTSINPSSSLGNSLVNTMLGADALRSAPPQSQNPSPTQIAQAASFPDTQGNWASTFIEALAARDIIRGFPDGTFRPNEPVTRAQFAAMIRKAFPRNPLRPPIRFADVPQRYWGYEAVEAAYQTGFLEGYPNNVFIPEQNIPRVQVLVSLASGLNLSPSANVASLLNSNYQDAAQIPDYARDAVAAATLNQLVVNYPTVALLNPNQLATRADVAAFIYQALVKEGALPPLNASDVAARYVVGYQVAQPPQTPDIATLRQQYLLPAPPLAQVLERVLGGNTSLSTPTAFGADNFRGFFGGTFQNRTRFSNRSDGAVTAGIGVGDASKLVGVEAALSIYDLVGDPFEDGGVSFKVHHRFPGDLAVAVGVENAITFGNTDGGKSVYGVVSKVFPLSQDASAPFSRVTASVGLGGGRFRSENAIRDRDESPNVFGSVGLQVLEPVTLVADWTGQDLNLGLSLVPIRGTPLIITPGVADVTGNAGDGPRFILGVGYAF